MTLIGWRHSSPRFWIGNESRYVAGWCCYKTFQLYQAFLNKMTDIHLHSHLDSEIEPNGDIKRCTFWGDCAADLLIAAINYVNLATARSATRQRNWHPQSSRSTAGRVDAAVLDESC
ncbi:MAG: hypothetical protein IPJ74_24910 [Saprospiraceae bacterium]|nr:hypothetical protein [Saprospiraceae bacterium]